MQRPRRNEALCTALIFVTGRFSWCSDFKLAPSWQGSSSETASCLGSLSLFVFDSCQKQMQGGIHKRGWRLVNPKSGPPGHFSNNMILSSCNLCCLLPGVLPSSGSGLHPSMKSDNWPQLACSERPCHGITAEEEVIHQPHEPIAHDAVRCPSHSKPC